jgi:hypothetical protein
MEFRETAYLILDIVAFGVFVVMLGGVALDLASGPAPIMRRTPRLSMAGGR